MSCTLLNTRWFRIGIQRDSVMMAILRSFVRFEWQDLFECGRKDLLRNLGCFASTIIRYLQTELKFTQIVLEIKERS